MNTTAAVLVRVKETKLTDGSIVFDVVSIPDPMLVVGGKVIITSESESGAWVIADAINQHAVDVWGGPR